eukprot:5310273-Pleurochrysis_carterae.AAC.2
MRSTVSRSLIIRVFASGLKDGRVQKSFIVTRPNLTAVWIQIPLINASKPASLTLLPSESITAASGLEEESNAKVMTNKQRYQGNRAPQNANQHALVGRVAARSGRWPRAEGNVRTAGRSRRWTTRPNKGERARTNP